MMDSALRGIKTNRGQLGGFFMALKDAVFFHGDQKRKFSGEPYVLHPIRVAELILQKTDDWHLAAAGLLHDALEDTEMTRDQVAETIGVIGLGLVLGVTKDKSLGKGEAEKEFLSRFAKADRDVVILKLADRVDNLRDLLGRAPEEFRRSYIANTRQLIGAVPAEAMSDPTVQGLLVDIGGMIVSR